MAHQVLKVTRVFQPQGYSHAIRAGDTVYIAGQVARDLTGALVGRGDFEMQAQQVYRNLQAILEEIGGGLENVVKMTTYLTHSGYVDKYRAVRSRLFAPPEPTNTLLIVQSLASPDFLIEVEAVAVLNR
ncbi:MAG: RidA family protein [Candidatus Lambdaproteobacteria bacterium]|nr:RidA family protein [Candidatus Lambdaproteobacteria bacterium]